uniref:(California timema) hypothetical protein n=1 Tax=Timema californicum TaxID=61474 RepID=A0A7R9PC10_TIMCA|nr:unnamed protein product [Timema californicum]
MDNTQDEDIRTCPKLTNEHIRRYHIKKMKVSTCAQVFSHRVSSMMRMLANWARDDCHLDKETANTADLLLFMDKLFDSVNGNSIHASNGKMLRCAVSETELGAVRVMFYDKANFPEFYIEETAPTSLSRAPGVQMEN